MRQAETMVSTTNKNRKPNQESLPAIEATLRCSYTHCRQGRQWLPVRRVGAMTLRGCRGRCGAGPTILFQVDDGEDSRQREMEEESPLRSPKGS